MTSREEVILHILEKNKKTSHLRQNATVVMELDELKKMMDYLLDSTKNIVVSAKEIGLQVTTMHHVHAVRGKDTKNNKIIFKTP